MNAENVSISEDLREAVRQKLKIGLNIPLHERSMLMRLIDEYAASKSSDIFDAYLTEIRGEIVYTEQANKWKNEYMTTHCVLPSPPTDKQP